ncbi:hypothetical protein KCU91_g12982, partial [Aureobasidium melanogenum]
MFKSASKGLTSDGGINWDWFLLDAHAPPYHVKKNVWTALMNEYPGQKEDFEQQVKTLFNLDLKQMEFIRHFLENDTGVSILFGPAGSGKTFTVVATLLLYLATNKKYREGLKELGNRHRALDCYHRRGVWLMMDVDARSGEPKPNSDLKNFDFIYDFHKTITGWTNENPYYNDEECSALFETKKEFEALLYKAYFDEVDAVFVPLASAAHPILSSFFEPTLLVIDDAATAVPVDLLTGVVPYRDTIQNAILAGDPISVGGRHQTKEEMSFTIISTTLRCLAEQHRMRPELFNPINEVFYKGSPTKISSVNNYLKNTFGAASSDGDRFAVDLNGKKNASKNWRASKSLCNYAGAEAIVKIVEGLLKHPPPPNGTQIQPRDILISTLYAGQEASKQPYPYLNH